MFQSVAIAPGLTATVNLSYTHGTTRAMTSVSLDIGLVVTGTNNGGQDIHFKGDGAFVFDQTYKVPVITDTIPHHYHVMRRVVDGVVAEGQLYGLYLSIIAGANTIPVIIEETIYPTTTVLAEPDNLRATEVVGSGGSMVMLEWSNLSSGAVEILHYIQADGNYDSEKLVLLGAYQAPLGSTSYVLQTGTGTKYHRFVVRRVSDVPTAKSAYASVLYRSLMISISAVSSRIMRNGVLVSWVDPNPENAGKVLKYRIKITGTGGYTSTVLTESDQRVYYFANLPQGREYTFSVAVIDPITDAQTPFTHSSEPLFLVFTRFGDAQPFDYRLGTSLVSHLFIGDQVVWTRS
ncbi:minor tail protein [Brevibacterium phage Cantare]|uniref:Minor tail protein n=1 Tax=Brevibacterium phage Cantare TaxID=2338395 RepID=A0A3G3LZ23_9CAUD|nr:minor tail protein [Brevibacterium phage Cantare]AYQ99257.1 minor tail protein [Brevibacterium phage Cantare]